MDVSVKELRDLFSAGASGPMTPLSHELLAAPVRQPCARFEGLKILVLQRGWVVVGRATHDGTYVTVENGSVVRRWGTTKGLGELAASGPRSNTVLDPFVALTVHELGVVAIFDCDETKWGAECKSTDS